MEQTIIKQKAQEILDQYGFKRPVDVVQLAESMGFAVGNAKIGEDDDGFILVNKDAQEILGIKTQKLIGVNYELDLFTKRLIIARALGYYILHAQNKPIYAQRLKHITQKQAIGLERRNYAYNKRKNYNHRREHF